jgi:RNA polymerase sigma-70 factor (ECF subfamily)
LTAEEERAAIERVLGGDSSAFEKLVLENQKNVYNLALRLTGDENDALDMSQDAFLRAYMHLDSFRGESMFSVWMYRITYNVCTDFLRKKTRERRFETVSIDDDGGDDGYEFEIPDVRELPEDALLRAEYLRSVSRCMDALRPIYRDVLVMREITGMSYAEIAAATGLEEGTVKSRISRARNALARAVALEGTFKPARASKGKNNKKNTEATAKRLDGEEVSGE